MTTDSSRMQNAKSLNGDDHSPITAAYMITYTRYVPVAWEIESDNK